MTEPAEKTPITELVEQTWRFLGTEPPVNAYEGMTRLKPLTALYRQLDTAQRFRLYAVCQALETIAKVAEWEEV